MITVSGINFSDDLECGDEDLANCFHSLNEIFFTEFLSYRSMFFSVSVFFSVRSFYIIHVLNVSFPSKVKKKRKRLTQGTTATNTTQYSNCDCWQRNGNMRNCYKKCKSIDMRKLSQLKWAMLNDTCICIHIQTHKLRIKIYNWNCKFAWPYEQSAFIDRDFFLHDMHSESFILFVSIVASVASIWTDTMWRMQIYIELNAVHFGCLVKFENFAYFI